MFTKKRTENKNNKETNKPKTQNQPPKRNKQNKTHTNRQNDILYYIFMNLHHIVT